MTDAPFSVFACFACLRDGDVSRKQYDHAMGLLKSAAEDGGRFVTGGGRPPGLETGCQVSPTIITDVSRGSRVAKEEIFAPVLVVFTYTSEEEALQIVNNTEYGLNDAVYSADIERARGSRGGWKAAP
jgi:acyl-CoA reductase-like NAD-dependent aldehyde dehydrogenase